MADVFISYAHSTAKQAQGAAAALRTLGYSVWLDDDLASHRAYTIAIEEQLVAAQAALVIWSADAATSEWVLSEANRAREDHKLVQLVIDKTRLPMSFDQVQCADLAGWSGDGEHPNWRKVTAGLAELVGAGAPTTSEPARQSLRPPSKPSIAVLPFANLSNDPEQEYFADGMVEEIVAALTRYSSILVIASGSSLSFKGKDVAPLEIARQLGVRYLLEGSVRKAGNRVRIAAKLTDAADGTQMWAKRFEDTLEDVFALQDTVANSVVSQIEPTIQAAEIRRANARPTENLGAYDLYLRALHAFSGIDRSGLERAASLLDRAVAQDMDYALALAVASAVRGQLLAQENSANPEEDRARALESRARALRAGGDDPEVLLWLAVSGILLGLRSRGVEDHAEDALAALPGSSMAWLAAGCVSLVGGDWPLARSRLETALRLDPRSAWRFWIVESLGISLFAQRHFEEAIPLLLEVADLRAVYAPWMLSLAASALGHLGRPEDARRLLEGQEAPGGYFFALFPPEFDALRRAGLARIHADA